MIDSIHGVSGQNWGSKAAVAEQRLTANKKCTKALLMEFTLRFAAPHLRATFGFEFKKPPIYSPLYAARDNSSPEMDEKTPEELTQMVMGTQPPQPLPPPNPYVYSHTSDEDTSDSDSDDAITPEDMAALAETTRQCANEH
jgi:hypothetical protein